ncbi:hypothetical protein LCGC14_1271850 [marine sediment metagenome]|uniref:Zona occludens toxin N-terminal domain-containing protein n=1 Tax=marine sediment metagenome TaxID=412755 RepID=A0A0F9KXV8_9ZZZZ
MPKVTDLQYQLEGFLIEKMDCIHTRVTKRKLDGIFLIDGDEGFGKTGISILLAKYIAWKTDREFNLDHIFFDPKELIAYINSTKKQVIIWDEAALGGLASGWQNKVQQMVIQTLMTCRSRQHIIFFNCPKFYRLNKYFVMDRAEGLIHVYSENRIDAGKVAYFKKDQLEYMMEYWTKKHKHPYKVFYRKQLRGNFIDAFKLDILSEDAYDKKKDSYTEKLLSQYSNDRYNEKLLKLQHSVYKMQGITQKEKSKCIGLGTDTISAWGKIPSKYPEIFKEVA